MAANLLKRFEGKVAIVTGGASGIGEATVRLFANQGARGVVIVDVQAEKGRAVAESIGSERCSYVHCDVSDEEQVKSVVDYTVATYGGLDIMFSNAGIVATSLQTILDLDFAEYDRVMSVNARGTAACVKHAARKMVEMGTRGSIICTSSAGTAKGGANVTDYLMSKKAVLGLVRAASIQLGAHGIRVNALSPGAVVTGMSKKIGVNSIADVDSVFGPFISLKGVALTPELMAEAAAFLASDQAAFVTGQDLMVDGGLITLPFVNPNSE